MIDKRSVEPYGVLIGLMGVVLGSVFRWIPVFRARDPNH
jgi:hypothetical protein